MSRIIIRALLVGGVMFFLVGMLALLPVVGQPEVTAQEPSPRPPWNTFTPTPTNPSPPTNTPAPPPPATAPPPTEQSPTPQMLPVTGVLAEGSAGLWFGLGLGLVLLGCALAVMFKSGG